MKFHVYLACAALSVLANPAIQATVLPIGTAAHVETSTGTPAQSSDSNANERRTQRPNRSRCSTTCGSPTLNECTAFLETQPDNSSISICAGAESSGTGEVGDCAFAYINQADNGERCISGSEFHAAAAQLVNDCVKGMNVGGCLLLSDGSFVCNYNRDLQPCHPLL